MRDERANRMAQETTVAIERLLEEARAGKLNGIAFVAHYRTRKVIAVLPWEGLGAVKLGFPNRIKDDVRSTALDRSTAPPAVLPAERYSRDSSSTFPGEEPAMAMTKCKECGNDLSTRAAACPKCGAAQPKPTSGATWLIAILIAIGFITSAILPSAEKPATSPSPAPSRAVDATPAPVACDQGAAVKVREGLVGLAQIAEKDGRVTFHWGPIWDNENNERRLRLIRSAADSDACLTGRTREIRFYSNGRLVGTASPTYGITLTN